MTIPNDALGWLLADPYLSAARGKFGQGSDAGQALVYQVYGENTDIDTNEEDVWEKGGIWVPPTAARLHNIKSDDVDDDGFGTSGAGAQQVFIRGLDANWDIVSETVTLNGTANVATTNSYIRINQMFVTLSGASNTNQGTITATAQTDNTVTTQIGAAEGKAHSAIFSVPRNYTCYVIEGHACLGKKTNGYANVVMKAHPFDYATWLNGHKRTLSSTGTSSEHFAHIVPMIYAQKTDIKYSAATSADNMAVFAGFTALLIDER